MFSRAKKNTPIVGLDVQTSSVAATEIIGGGSSPRVGKTAIAPLPPGATRDGEVIDSERFAAALKELFSSQKLGRRVRVGLANQRAVVRVMRMPTIDSRDDLETAIRFQAKDEIPMALEQAVIDWQVMARGVGDGGQQMDVAVVAARRDTVSGVLESIKLAGLRPVGIDMSAFGMIRALRHEVSSTLPGAVSDASSDQQGDAGKGGAGADSVPRLYCNLGDVVNLAVARDGDCLFCRVSPFGVEGIAQRLAERRGLDLEHAREWLFHVGLEQDPSEIEGDPEIVLAAREALTDGASKLADELRLSLDFFSAQEGAMPIESVVASGPGTTISGLSERLASELDCPFESVRPAALSHLDNASAARLTLSYGLGLEV
jgi:type IV pilus assembly protein PilM